MKSSQIIKMVFKVEMLSLENKESSGAINSFCYIEEEFESDDGRDWIKL